MRTGMISMNEKEAVMAKVFEGGFPGQAPGQGNAPFAEGDFQPGEAPPVDVLDLSEQASYPSNRTDF